MAIKVPSVWFVDDDEDDRLFIRSAFDDLSPSVMVLTLNNGEQLLAELEMNDTLPQLILLDLNMPGLTGFDVLTQLRTTNTWTNLPVVILTTSTSDLDRTKSLASGANDYIVKPTSYSQFTTMAQTLARQWALVN